MTTTIHPPVRDAMTSYLIAAWAGFIIGFLFGVFWAGRHD